MALYEPRQIDPYQNPYPKIAFPVEDWKDIVKNSIRDQMTMGFDHVINYCKNENDHFAIIFMNMMRKFLFLFICSFYKCEKNFAITVMSIEKSFFLLYPINFAITTMYIKIIFFVF